MKNLWLHPSGTKLAEEEWRSFSSYGGGLPFVLQLKTIWFRRVSKMPSRNRHARIELQTLKDRAPFTAQRKVRVSTATIKW